MSYLHVGKDHFISLITKKLNSELNIAELKELNSWLSESSDNSHVLNDFKDVWGSVSTYKSTITFDADTAYQDFVKKYNIPQSSDNSTSATAAGGISILRWLLSAVVVAALVYGGYQMMNNINNAVSNDQLVSRTINLDAFSTATLAPSTSLNFNKEDFTISKLDGQMYLDLAKESGALNLNFEDVQAQAKNTMLNLQSYGKEDKFIADIEKGSVQFEINDDQVTVGQGKRLIFDNKSKTTEITIANPKSSEWKDGFISWNNTPLNEVFTSIEKFYGVEITVIDNSPINAHSPFTAINYKPANLNECLQLLTDAYNMTIDREGKKIEISKISAK